MPRPGCVRGACGASQGRATNALVRRCSLQPPGAEARAAVVFAVKPGCVTAAPPQSHPSLQRPRPAPQYSPDRPRPASATPTPRRARQSHRARALATGPSRAADFGVPAYRICCHRALPSAIARQSHAPSGRAAERCSDERCCSRCPPASARMEIVSTKDRARKKSFKQEPVWPGPAATAWLPGPAPFGPQPASAAPSTRIAVPASP
jgi:hypothetical protein